MMILWMAEAYIFLLECGSIIGETIDMNGGFGSIGT